MSELNPISSDQLYEYRKNLAQWDKKGPNYTLSLVTQLNKVEYTQPLLHQTKIIKTVKTILQVLNKKECQQITMFNDDQVNMLKLKLQNLYVEMKGIRDQGKDKPTRAPAELQGDIIFQVSKTVKTIQFIINKQNMEEENFVKTDYLDIPQRERYRDIIIKEFKKISDGLTVPIKGDIDMGQKITDLCLNLEKKFYDKHLLKHNGKQFYQDDLKTMIAYLKKDQTGVIFTRLITGIFSISDAILLRLGDWVDQQQKNMHEFDANYYREIKIKEMTQAQGAECPSCKNDYLYLMEEKQLRRADEPSTKFFECLACGHKQKK